MNSKALAFSVLAAFSFAAAAQPAGSGQAAKVINSTCIGCHSIAGYQSSFPQVYRVPMIAGQSAKYIESALLAYKRGERSHPTMAAIAQGLTDQQIAELAAYYAARGAAMSVAAK